jgi:AcrR family transcriptional regulator
MDEIVAAARTLVPEPGGLTLRAVAQKMGITAPALYRYVSNLQDLVELVALDIDREAADLLEQARDSQPADDPAARIVCASIAFRRWALAHRAEFSLVFANPVTAGSCQNREEFSSSPSGLVFTALLVQLWERYRFPVPALADLDPDVAEALADPAFPMPPGALPPEARGLLWTFMRSWASLYGTVTLEVFGHLDPSVIESGAMFRSMLEDQARLFAITDELPRLQPMIDREMGRETGRETGRGTGRG